MNFLNQLALTEQRMKRASDFEARWGDVIAVLPDEFCVSSVAGGYASLYYRRWVPATSGGASLKSISIFACIEKSAEVLGMLCFCKVLRAYGLPFNLATRIYYICIPRTAA